MDGVTDRAISGKSDLNRRTFFQSVGSGKVCQHCGRPITYYLGGWIHVSIDDMRLCHERNHCAAAPGVSFIKTQEPKVLQG